jgi:hypothetical protein
MNRKLVIEKINMIKLDNDTDCRIDLIAAVFTRSN